MLRQKIGVNIVLRKKERLVSLRLYQRGGVLLIVGMRKVILIGIEVA